MYPPRLTSFIFEFRMEEKKKKDRNLASAIFAKWLGSLFLDSVFLAQQLMRHDI